jgi:alkylation response protein AidB-like acyl-CoA dehydrogenase
MIDLTDAAPRDPAGAEEFRAYCRSWLGENRPEAPRFRLPQSPLEVMTVEQCEYLQRWQNACYEAGLVGCDYPREYGGGGMSNHQRIANEEMARAATPFLLNVTGLGMAAPTLVHHGSEDNKRRFIPKILSCEEIWCQGFSEPGAGSDLANVQTRAEPKGGSWVVNGHKVWNSLAQFAHWMILLARTSPPKHAGLTYFLAPVQSALGRGVTVRPLRKMTGEAGFNEVLIEDLEVADGLRVDEVGAGWAVAQTTLLHERGASPLVTPGGGGVSLPAGFDVAVLIDLARGCVLEGRPALDDDVLRDRLMMLLIREEGLKAHMRRALVPALWDDPLRLPMQAKLLSSEHIQQVSALALEIEGQRSSLYVGDENAPQAAHWPLSFMNSYGFTIAAGTSEVQRNLLGERVLGLPKTK